MIIIKIKIIIRRFISVLANFFASLFFPRARYEEKIGINAADSIASANNCLNWLGIKNEILNASVSQFAPKK